MNKNKFLLLFVLCCVLPLLLAKLVLEMGWFNGGVSSKGQWQQQEVFLLAASDDKAHWRLAVSPGTSCSQRCHQALYTVKQLYVGLGRKQTQVQPVYLAESLQESQAIKDFPMFSYIAALQPVPAALQDHILLIDQQGLVLLSYPMPAEADMATTAKAIRQDLLKLLNYDRTSV